MTFDTTALRTPVDRAEVWSFRTQMLSSTDSVWTPLLPAKLILALIAAGILVPSIGTVLLVNAFKLSAAWAAVGWVIIFLIVLADGVYLLRGELGLRAWQDHLRCSRFAAANGLAYAPVAPVATHIGVIFRVGGNQETVRRMWSESGPFIDCGTHRYVTGSGRNRETHEWQYAAILLPGSLPRMILDAHANNVGEGVGSGRFDPAFRQSLGSGMDDHFDLYCRPENRFDAFHIFTPDLMAHLIDQARFLDVEIASEWMFLYTRWGLSVSDPATWARLDAIEQTITRLLRDRARAYRDREQGTGRGPAA